MYVLVVMFVYMFQWWFFDVGEVVVVLVYQGKDGWVQFYFFFGKLVFFVQWLFLVGYFGQYFCFDKVFEVVGEDVVGYVEVVFEVVEMVYVEKVVV